MHWTNLDKVTRSFLLRKQLTLHWYVQILKYVSDCLRERHFDTLRVVKAVRLPVDPQTKIAQLPCDYIDFVKVGVEVGAQVRPFVQRSSMSNLTAIDAATGARVAHASVDDGAAPGGGVNVHGESLGARFGGVAGSRDVFEVFPRRGASGELQLDPSFAGTEIYLEYVSKVPKGCDAAVKVDALAQETLEAYAEWQWKEASRSYNNGDRQLAYQHFDKAWGRLKARKNPFTIEEIREAFNLSYTSSPKS